MQGDRQAGREIGRQTRGRQIGREAERHEGWQAERVREAGTPKGRQACMGQEGWQVPSWSQ
jgi:hypothetical protein